MGAAYSAPVGAPGAIPDTRELQMGDHPIMASSFDSDALEAMLDAINNDPQSIHLAMLDGLRKQLEDNPEIANDPHYELASKVLDGLVSVQMQRLTAIGKKANDMFGEAVDNMRPITESMVQDERQFMGLDRRMDSKRYPSDAPNRDVQEPGRIVLHATRTRTMNFSARLLDMLAPTNDWSVRIKPPSTPKPQDYPGYAVYVQQAQAQHNAEQQSAAQAAQQQNQPFQPQPFTPPPVEDFADIAAANMQEKVFEHFERMNLRAHISRVLDNTCEFGSGQLCGPYPEITYERNFQSGELEIRENYVPGCHAVRAFRFFYDLTPDLAKSCATFELEIWNKRQLTDFKAYPGVITTNVDQLLDMEKPSLPPKITESINLRNKESGLVEPTDGVWGVVKGNLIITAKEYEDITGIEWTSPDMPLIEIHFGDDGLPLKFKLTPLEHDWRPPYYDMKMISKDDTIFGYSVPNMGRSAQQFVDGAVTATCINAAVSVAPIIVTNRGDISPNKEEWRIRGVNILNNNNPEVDAKDAIGSIQIDSNVEGNLRMLDQALAQLDQDTNYEQILGGNMSGETVPASGLAQLINLASVFQRKIARNWDTDFLGPFTERVVWFENLYGDDPSLKGPHQVVGIASTEMVAKDIATQHAQAFTQLSANPQFAGFSDPYEIFLMNLRLIDVPDKDKIAYPRDKAMANQAAAQQGQLSPEVVQMAEIQRQAKRDEMEHQRDMLKISTDAETALMKAHADLQVAKMGVQTELIKASASAHVDMAELAQASSEAAQNSMDKRFETVLEATMKTNIERAKLTAPVGERPYSAKD